MKKLISQVVSAGFGLWLATIFVPGVEISIFENSNFFGFPLTSVWEIYILLAIILGLLNYFVKPVISAISLPLRLITLGLFRIVINALFVWVMTLMFKELRIDLWLPLVYTTLIIWILNLSISKFLIREEHY